MLRIGSKKDAGLSYKCSVRMLDDNEVFETEFQSWHKGRQLLDQVFNRLNLAETDYFGLRYVDQHKQRHWIDATKNILRQIKNLHPILFCFRVKFYPADPLKLREEITRYHLFLQLRRDLLHGRLYCGQTDASYMAACIIQADMGDCPSEDKSPEYVSDYKVLLKQSPKMEEKIAEEHRNLQTLGPAEAEWHFLKRASALDTYGVDPYSVKDHRGVQLYLGLNHSGILTFVGSKKTHHFKWIEVQKLNYEGKMFIIHLCFMEDPRTKRKLTVGFKCASASACRNLWRAAVEQRLFYTMQNSHRGVVVTGGSFFSRGSRFRYQGRCEREAVEESLSLMRSPPSVRRGALKGTGRASSLPTTPADSDAFDSLLSRAHRPLPYIDRSSSLDEEVLCGTDSPPESPDDLRNGPFSSPGAPYCSESTLPSIGLLEPLMEGAESKSRSSSMLEAKNYLDPDPNCEGGYGPRQHHNFPSTPELSPHRMSSRKSPLRTSRISGDREVQKRLYRHEAVEEEDFPHQLSYCDYNGRNPEDMCEYGDTSSTETLGPPTEPLDVPLNQRLINPCITVPAPNIHINPSSPTKNHTSPTDNRISTSSQHRKIFNRKTLKISFSARGVVRFLKVFFSAMFLVLLLLVFLIIVALEADLAVLEGLTATREMALFRLQYYEPIRRTIIGEDT